jgi:hypothetical protein
MNLFRKVHTGRYYPPSSYGLQMKKDIIATICCRKSERVSWIDARCMKPAISWSRNCIYLPIKFSFVEYPAIVPPFSELRKIWI